MDPAERCLARLAGLPGSTRSRRKWPDPMLSGPAEKPNGGKEHERYFYEAVTGSWCTLRSPDK
ncbi:MAG: hypothetical protein ACLTNH_13480, partial [Enterocloster sp.]